MKKFRFSLPKVLIFAGVTALLLIISVFAFLMMPAYAASANTLAFVKDAVTQQQKIEQELHTYYQAGKFTFAVPMVIQNPYQTAPLTALVIFDTPEDSQVSIHVPGKTAQAAVDFTFPGFQKHHEIPIYGLYAGALNQVKVSMKTQAGQYAENTLDLQTEPLSVDIQKFSVDKVDPVKYNPGFNFTAMNQKPVFDINGDVRWYSTEKSWTVYTPLKNGRFLYTYEANGQRGDVLMEKDLLGKIYTVYNIAGGIHHDIYELPTGNLLVTSSDPKATTTEDIILEIERDSGHIVRYFDMKNILDQNRLPMMDFGPLDWLHMNSIVYDPADQSIIVSGRAQSSVVKLNYPGMQIKWILGPHDNWSQKYQPYLLTPVGKDFEWAWEQHHATLFSPDVPGDHLIEILLFDNGLFRSFDPAQVLSPNNSYTRVVHYRINEAAMTIEQVWEYGKARGSAIFSYEVGSAYHLANGDVLGNWGTIAKDAQGRPLTIKHPKDNADVKIIEVDPATNTVIFECSVANTTNYRTLRVGFYDGYSETNAYLSTTLNNTTGNDLVDRYFLVTQDLKKWTYSNSAPLALIRFIKSLRLLVTR